MNHFPLHVFLKIRQPIPPPKASSDATEPALPTALIPDVNIIPAVLTPKGVKFPRMQPEGLHKTKSKGGLKEMEDLKVAVSPALTPGHFSAKSEVGLRNRLTQSLGVRIGEGDDDDETSAVPIRVSADIPNTNKADEPADESTVDAGNKNEDAPDPQSLVVLTKLLFAYSSSGKSTLTLLRASLLN